MPKNCPDIKTTGNQLPKAVHMQVVWLIKDYHRMVNERKNILYSSPYNDGQPRGTDTTDTTANKAIKLSALSERVEGIDQAIHAVNCHFTNQIKRDDVDLFDCLDAFNDYGYFCYVLFDPNKDSEPSLSTWKRFRRVLTYKIAENLKYI